MRIHLDSELLRRTTRDAAGRAKSVRITLRYAGTGEVLVSRRRKESWESGRAFHGKAIANRLAARGHDPFAYPQEVAAEVSGEIARQTTRAIEGAWRSRRHRLQTIRTAVRQGAEFLSTWARQNIERGQLGENTARYRAIKHNLIRRGRATGRYGDPPPFGVLTGRFLEGIRARWRRGR